MKAEHDGADEPINSDAMLEEELQRVLRASGGTIPLGSFFLHRPDLKRFLGDKKLKDFVQEREHLFELVEPAQSDATPAVQPTDDEPTPTRRKAVPFGGRGGLMLKLKQNTADAATTATTSGEGVARKDDVITACTVAGRTSLNILKRVAAAEIAAMQTKLSLPGGNPDPRNVHPDTGAIRVGYASNAFKMRKKIRSAYTLAPSAWVQGLYPQPAADRPTEVNRIAMLFSLYLLKFVEEQSELFEVSDGPADPRCGVHHVKDGRCSCNTYVSARVPTAGPPAAGGDAAMEDSSEEDGAPPRPAGGVVGADAKRDTQLADRLQALLRGTNPRKGVDIAWLGQDPKIRKYLNGRPMIAAMKGCPNVDVFEREGRHVARTQAAKERLEQTEAHPREPRREGEEGPAKRRRYDPGLPEVPAEHLGRIGSAEGLAAVAKPPHHSTEALLRCVSLAAEAAGGGEVISISRLDKETSGVLVFATSQASEEHMKAQYTEHLVGKRYRALCTGYAPASGRVEAKLLLSDTPGRSRVRVHKNGKESITEYTSQQRYRRVAPEHTTPEVRAAIAVLHLRKFLPCDLIGRVLGCVIPAPTASERFTLISCKPLTGRTHQIRVHMSYKGHPLVADSKYGRGNQAAKHRVWCPRNFLHCAEVSGAAVDGAKFSFTAPLPEDLTKALRQLVPVG